MLWFLGNGFFFGVRMVFVFFVFSWFVKLVLLIGVCFDFD